MAQLIVRKLDEAVVNALRAEATREKISVEEAHRRVLQRALLPEPPEKKKTLWECFPTCDIPEEYDDIFERDKSPDRPIPDFSE